MKVASLRSLNPLRLLNPANYEKLPAFESSNGGPASSNFASAKGRFPSGNTTQRFRWGRISLRVAVVVIAAIFLAIYLLSGGNRGKGREDEVLRDVSAEEHANTRFWEVFPR